MNTAAFAFKIDSESQSPLAGLLRYLPRERFGDATNCRRKPLSIGLKSKNSCGKSPTGKRKRAVEDTRFKSRDGPPEGRFCRSAIRTSGGVKFMSDETKSLMPVRSPSAPGTVGLAGQQRVTGKWIRFWIALSLTLSPSGAFAQQTSAKVQTNDKAAWLGKGNGNKGTDSTAPTDPNYVIGPQDALDNAYYIYKDFNGNTRSGTGGCWDLGAYQH